MEFDLRLLSGGEFVVVRRRLREQDRDEPYEVKSWAFDGNCSPATFTNDSELSTYNGTHESSGWLLGRELPAAVDVAVGRSPRRLVGHGPPGTDPSLALGVGEQSPLVARPDFRSDYDGDLIMIAAPGTPDAMDWVVLTIGLFGWIDIELPNWEKDERHHGHFTTDAGQVWWMVGSSLSGVRVLRPGRPYEWAELRTRQS